MKITIDIKQNDYIRPTEVRQDLVKSICEFIIKQMENGVWVEQTYFLTLDPKMYFLEIYINLRNNGEISGFSDKKQEGNQIRIRTVEMQAVFEALQDAGYSIFGNKNATNGHIYVFTKKPSKAATNAERIQFTEFID